MRTWYRITAQADPSVAELLIYGVIGRSFFDEEAVTARELIADLAALPESVQTIRARINSPGGDVFDGLAIANALRAQSAEKGRRVEVAIEALAASAASVVAMAGDRVTIADNGVVMVHLPSAITFGDEAAHRSMAEALATVTDSIVTTYRWHSTLSPEALLELMEATTWMGAEEAVAKGFADEVLEPSGVVEASFPAESLRALGAIPEPFRARVAALVARPAPPASAPPPVEVAEPVAVLAACEAAGVLSLARSLIDAKVTPAELAQRVAAAREIRALCGMAKLPELAEPLISDRVSPATVRALLTTFTAKLDCIEIDAGLAPDGEPARSAGWPEAIARAQGRRLNTVEIYERLNHRPEETRR